MGGEFPSALPMALFQLLWAGEASLSPCSAPNQLFELLRCSGRLIFRKSFSAFSPKRSTFSRCAASDGRGKLRSPLFAHRNAPSGHSGVSHGLFMISHHRPCGRWCFARLIRQAETLELQLHSQPPSKRTALSALKRSCFRFAALTLRCRTPLSCPRRTDLSSVQKTPHLFSDGQTGCSSARRLLFSLPG